MTREENEKFYDENIAPELARLANLCGDIGMSFIAMVANEKDSYCTKYMAKFDNPSARIAAYANEAKGNVDILFMKIEKDAEKYGDNSIYLYKLRHYKDLIGSKHA